MSRAEPRNLEIPALGLPPLSVPGDSAPVRLILAGGGLANGLIAYRLAMTRPDVEWQILEAGDRLGGNHTWSFHAGDLTVEQNRWFAPFVEHTWPDYEVRFPGMRRPIPLGYRSVSAERFRAVLEPLCASRCRMASAVAQIGPTHVRLADGTEIAGDAVIDGRGFRPGPHMAIAFQKFLGLEVRTRRPHGLAHPIVMDATVTQRDGYRFVYSLPLAPDRLLIEDTFYSEAMGLDVAQTRRAIADYAADRGWEIDTVLREEEGVLPIALGGDIEAFWSAGEPVARAGLGAALFHPTTGYSLPWAVRLADAVAGLQPITAPGLFELTRRMSIKCWREAGFYRLLDRFLFQASAPERRYRLLERFYGLDIDLISRFYAGRSTLADKIRVLSGKPPIPISRALPCLFANPLPQAEMRS